MNCLWRWGDAMNHESFQIVASRTAPGVTFRLRRISFRGRLELLRAVREVSGRQEFAAAGESLGEQLDAAVLEQELDEIYLRWGLLGIDGLVVDGDAAEVETLVQRGPEPLCREIVDGIKRECGLMEEEIKN